MLRTAPLQVRAAQGGAQRLLNMILSSSLSRTASGSDLRLSTREGALSRGANYPKAVSVSSLKPRGFFSPSSAPRVTGEPAPASFSRARSLSASIPP